MVGEEAMKNKQAAPNVNAGGVLHQRRRLPMSPMTMAVGGFVIVATIGYFTLYAKAKPDATPSEVAKIAAGGYPNPK
ncbi:hypothetical protein QJS04_geneDACA003846 [Acorus gramineus]|uniref:Uncharacterized protein n=1 Tax=Acorus gramineus TaxID=55184 RepID=A0AAV9BHJ8_ACOGR|nr:hypothetical protein QJS04_geneDACA003846 [Acorus gramineus]